jgi:hypothetical protein
MSRAGERDKYDNQIVKLNVLKTRYGIKDGKYIDFL